jgi:hypothetical protein
MTGPDRLRKLCLPVDNFRYGIVPAGMSCQEKLVDGQQGRLLFQGAYRLQPGRIPATAAACALRPRRYCTIGILGTLKATSVPSPGRLWMFSV